MPEDQSYLRSLSLSGTDTTCTHTTMYWDVELYCPPLVDRLSLLLHQCFCSEKWQYRNTAEFPPPKKLSFVNSKKNHYCIIMIIILHSLPPCPLQTVQIEVSMKRLPCGSKVTQCHWTLDPCIGRLIKLAHQKVIDLSQE